MKMTYGKFEYKACEHERCSCAYITALAELVRKIGKRENKTRQSIADDLAERIGEMFVDDEAPQ